MLIKYVAAGLGVFLFFEFPTIYFTFLAYSWNKVKYISSLPVVLSFLTINKI